MTVVPTVFHPDGSIDVQCSNCGITTTISTAGQVHATPGAVGAHIIELDCSNCGSTSSHPLSGGSNAAAVQELFVRKAKRDGCPCSSPVTPGRPMFLVQGHIKLFAERMDGVGRWQIVGTLQ